MTERIIRADEVKVGHAVTKLVLLYRRRLRKGTYLQDQEIKRTKGRWPTVVDASFVEHGEGGEPTVYIELSDKPGTPYCTSPDDQVTIEEV